MTQKQFSGRNLPARRVRPDDGIAGVRAFSATLLIFALGYGACTGAPNEITVESDGGAGTTTRVPDDAGILLDGGPLPSGDGGTGADGGAPPPPDNPFCRPLTCESTDTSCGPIGDGCGNVVSCGDCTLPETCGGGGTPGQCGSALSTCTPFTCALLDVNCGPVADGCGGLLDCGTCTVPGESCGGGEQPNRCGGMAPPPGTCPAPVTCADVNANCGLIGNGCGGTVGCGSCPTGEVCGAAGPNRCGAPACTPLTCADVGAECGPIGDGCGGLIASCGSCTAPETCGGGGLPSVCGVRDSNTPPNANCGNGTREPGESCDDGNNDAGDGCAANCLSIESGFVCPTPGSDCVSTVICGDGVISAGETCDDRNLDNQDGCNAQCQLEAGWECPIVGAACQAKRCGDGIVAGLETCDDGDAQSGDGCSATCVVEDGYACSVAGLACVTTTCGDGVREGTEACDDGNFNTGDGCSPRCELEPICAGGSCAARCGDGIKLPDEECDDGNLQNGDGCSDGCVIESGFTCDVLSEDPNLSIVLRDFVGASATGSNSRRSGDFGPLHLDFEKYNGCRPDVVNVLDAEGKPALQNRNGCVENAASFAQWYRSDNAINRTVVDDIALVPVSGQAATYEFFDSSFFPLDGRGFQDPLSICAGGFCEQSRNDGHNFHFTSETRYWFTFRGGEKLTFDGDDDVWVFIDKKLAVDIAGVHGAIQRWIQLPDPNDVDPSAPINGARGGDNASQYVVDPLSLGLVPNGIYEVAVFQAERHTTQSQYRLTLSNFLSARSVCQYTCGDGIVTRFEVCDEGASNNTGAYGACAPSCLGYGPRCGDGIVQASFEACDDGENTTLYRYPDTSPLACAPGCTTPQPYDACTPTNCAALQAECGYVADGCGASLDCGECPANQQCTQSQCVETCMPATCAGLGASCGAIADGCGGILSCGECPPGESCGGGGDANVCGVQSSCVPRTCAQAGAACGPIGDGCGGILDCGDCIAGESCGGGGVANQCGSLCVPRTCSDADAECGPLGDGCGGVVDCGSCESPLLCGGAGVAHQCGFVFGG